MDIQQSERASVHYQPYAGGTTNTMGSEVVQRNPDQTTVFKTVSDSKRLHGRIRYNPDDKSKMLTKSDRLKDGRHTRPVKINGVMPWKNHFEIHAYSTGWQTSTKLGRLSLNIPGIEGMGNTKGPEGTTTTIKFDNIQDLKLSTWYNRRENTPHISVEDHPRLKNVEEIVFDDLCWFHDAYPFSGTSVGIRLGFSMDLQYESLEFKDGHLESAEHHVSRKYDEARTKNKAVRL